VSVAQRQSTFPICDSLPAILDILARAAAGRLSSTISGGPSPNRRGLRPPTSDFCPFLYNCVSNAGRQVWLIALRVRVPSPSSHVGRCSSMAKQMPSRSLYPRSFCEHRCGLSGLGYRVEHVTENHRTEVQIPSTPSHYTLFQTHQERLALSAFGFFWKYRRMQFAEDDRSR
jgi:hypothetical protein